MFRDHDTLCRIFLKLWQNAEITASAKSSLMYGTRGEGGRGSEEGGVGKGGEEGEEGTPIQN